MDAGIITSSTVAAWNFALVPLIHPLVVVTQVPDMGTLLKGFVTAEMTVWLPD